LNRIQIELEDLIDLMVNDVNQGTIEAFRMLHVWNSLVESSIMAHCGDGGPLRVEPMKVVPESPLLEEPQTAEVVGDELKAPKVNGFTKEEGTTHQTLTIGGEGERE
jgi:hypothetical protein